jgi:hypothetical protein
MSGIVVLTRPSHGCMHFKQKNFFCDFEFIMHILKDFERFVQDCNKLFNMDIRGLVRT